MENMAPELKLDDELDPTPASDVYALGLVFLELLSNFCESCDKCLSLPTRVQRDPFVPSEEQSQLAMARETALLIKTAHAGTMMMITMTVIATLRMMTMMMMIVMMMMVKIVLMAIAPTPSVDET